VTVAAQHLLVHITHRTRQGRCNGPAIAAGLSADCGISSLAGATLQYYYYYYYYYAAFNAPCVGHKADESQARMDAQGLFRDGYSQLLAVMPHWVSKCANADSAQLLFDSAVIRRQIAAQYDLVQSSSSAPPPTSVSKSLCSNLRLADQCVFQSGTELLDHSVKLANDCVLPTATLMSTSWNVRDSVLLLTRHNASNRLEEFTTTFYLILNFFCCIYPWTVFTGRIFTTGCAYLDVYSSRLPILVSF